jgi:two-component system response regulator AtoC
VILPEHLPPALIKGVEARRPPDVSVGEAPASAANVTASHEAGTPRAANDLHAEIRSIERARIIYALERCAGSQSQAARMLGVSRGTLIARIKEYGLPRPRKRDDEPGP